MADYPNGGTPPQIVTSTTTSPAPALPYTGSHSDQGVLIGGSLILLGVALLAARVGLNRRHRA